VVSEILAAMSGVIGKLDDRGRVIMALKYFHNMTLPELAPYVGVTPDEAARLHQVVILECHAEMLKVVA